MKFTRYLEANKEPAWEDKYIRYRELKKLIAQVRLRMPGSKSCFVPSRVTQRSNGELPVISGHGYTNNKLIGGVHVLQILEEGAPVYVPTALSLTVGREREDARSTPQEQFFLDLEADVKRINDFTTVRSWGAPQRLGCVGGQFRRDGWGWGGVGGAVGRLRGLAYRSTIRACAPPEAHPIDAIT